MSLITIHLIKCLHTFCLATNELLVRVFFFPKYCNFTHLCQKMTFPFPNTVRQCWQNCTKTRNTQLTLCIVQQLESNIFICQCNVIVPVGYAIADMDLMKNVTKHQNHSHNRDTRIRYIRYIHEIQEGSRARIEQKILQHMAHSTLWHFTSTTLSSHTYSVL